MKNIRMGTVFFVTMLLVAGAMTTAASGAPDSAPLDAAAESAIIIDHTSTDITAIPQAWIEAAKSTLHIGYGHTSHGSQLTDGMSGLVGFANGGGKGLALPADIFAWNNGGTGGALDLHDGAMGGDVGYYPDWVNNTRSYLGAPDPVTGRGASQPDVNVIIWSWCGQASGRTEETMLSTYLLPMTQLELEYPGVTFVYMTGHSDGTGESGNLHLRNQQIREYAIQNNKVLYDFYNIELYDPDGNYYGDKVVNDNCDYDSDGNGSRDRNWATEWQSTHTEGVDWYSCSCAHSQSLNCNQKAYAAWWLWARIAGWDGVTGGRPESDQTGNWTTPETWVGDVVPSVSDAVTITAGTAVTVDVDVQCQRLAIEHGATLIIPSGVTLTVADSVDNQGTMQQTRTVDNDAVAFLQIDGPDGFARYRGVEIDTPNDLGAVTVSVRALGAGEYCTSTGAGSPAYARRCFEIEATNTAAATVRLWALADEMNGIADPRVFRYVAPGWVVLSTNAATGTLGAYAYAEADTPGFSHFLIGWSGAPTAVDQRGFGVRAIGHERWLLLLAVVVALVGVAVGVRKLWRRLGGIE
ncbi:MAG: hypothetical protein JW918_00645 [Anaerolineae bacterium]|nr:hypothetical protein [Anaerolineae bacterium]